MLTGVILLKDNLAVNADRFSKDFSANSDAEMNEVVKDGSTLILNIEGATVAISSMAQPVAQAEIEAAAKRAYKWPTALKATQGHKGHLVVVVSEKEPDALKHYTILTEVLASLLRTTNAVAVYMPGQSMLIEKTDYLNEADELGTEYLPLNLWLYFGIEEGAEGNSGYTNGMKDFNKAELEIINSKAGLDGVRAFLFNIAHYIIENDAAFENGDTCGVTDDEEVAVEVVAGRFVKGTVCKLLYRP